jgi:hypothetical protein
LGCQGRGAVRRTRLSLAALGAGALMSAGPPRQGPYDIILFPTRTVPHAQGHARLVFADSPFGIAVTADGHTRYDVAVTAARLPVPSTLGQFSTYLAWAVTPDLTQWQRLGVVGNGTTTVGSVEYNKFLLVITAERDTTSVAHAGPTVLTGTSPSGWLQRFLTQPAFHGITD